MRTRSPTALYSLRVVWPELKVVPPALPLFGLKLLTDGRVIQVFLFTRSNEYVIVRSAAELVVSREVMSEAAIAPLVGSAEFRRFAYRVRLVWLPNAS